MSKRHFGFATVGSLISICFLFVINHLITPGYYWFLYPSFFLILWPLSLFFIMKKKYKLYAYFCSVMLIFYMVIENVLNSPEHPWVFYTAYPLIWWPITASIGKKAKTLKYAWIVTTITIFYYATLNLVLSPIHPWVIYPTYLILWWPITIHYVKKKNYFGLSVVGSIISILFFSLVNVTTSPNTLWAIYPIFVILWWPLTMYYFSFLKRKQESEKRKKATK